MTSTDGSWVVTRVKLHLLSLWSRPTFTDFTLWCAPPSFAGQWKDKLLQTRASTAMQYTTKTRRKPLTNVYFHDFFNAQSVNSVLNWMKRKRHVDLHTFTQITVSRRICGCTALSKNYIFFMSCISSHIFSLHTRAPGTGVPPSHLLWSTINAFILIDTIPIGTWWTSILQYLLLDYLQKYSYMHNNSLADGCIHPMVLGLHRTKHRNCCSPCGKNTQGTPLQNDIFSHKRDTDWDCQRLRPDRVR